jgi:ribosome biogenesis ATPase
LLYVDLPAGDERAEIVRTLVHKVPLGDVDRDLKGVLEEVEVLVRERCDGYSGADLAALVREAGVIALRKTLGALDKMDEESGERGSLNVRVGVHDFVRALDKVGPSVSVAQRRKYEALRSKFAGLPVGTHKDEEKTEKGNVA